MKRNRAGETDGKMNKTNVDTAELAYRVFGNGKINIVVETALCSCCAEWWHIAERLSSGNTVLVYDRAGYGESSRSQWKRTSANIVQELECLLQKLETEQKLIFIGHSQGGLYVQQFARMNPDRVKGVILIDPLSANDNRFLRELTPEEFKMSGVDKTGTYRLGLGLTRLHLGFLLRPLLKKAPPFYYGNDFSEGAAEYILNCLTKPGQYETAIAEYELSHDEAYIAELKEKGNFPDVPLVLITHCSKISEDEIVTFGNTTRELAKKVEGIWQQVMKEYLEFSKASMFLPSEKSSHYVHLTEPELIEAALGWIVKDEPSQNPDQAIDSQDNQWVK